MHGYAAYRYGIGAGARQQRKFNKSFRPRLKRWLDGPQSIWCRTLASASKKIDAPTTSR